MAPMLRHGSLPVHPGPAPSSFEPAATGAGQGQGLVPAGWGEAWLGVWLTSSFSSLPPPPPLCPFIVASPPGYQATRLASDPTVWGAGWACGGK